MTVTSTSLGPNTIQINLQGEISSAAFLVALDAAIVAGGWAQFDIFNPVYRVYRALNIDGISYKYAAVSIDIARQRFWLTSFESWNATTHVGTNEVFNYNGGYWQPYTFNNCDVIVFSNTRWLGFQTYTRNVGAIHPVFVMETTRDHPQDTAAGGIPCWGWMTPGLTSAGVPFASGYNDSYLFSSPRIKAGEVGTPAANKSFLATAFSRICSAKWMTNGYMSASSNAGIGTGLSGAAALGSTDVWDPSSVYASTLRVGHGSSELQGRMAGMKASRVPGAGLLNRVSIPVDTNYIYDAAGVQKEHWIFPITPEKPTTVGTGSVALATGGSYDALWNGALLLVNRFNNWIKYDLTANSLGVAQNNTQSIAGSVFDGQFVYFCNGNRIGKWDTVSDTFTYSTVIAGVNQARICFDGTNIWVVDAMTVATNLAVRRYDTSLNLIATIQVPQPATSMSAADIACDTFGNVAVLCIHVTSSGWIRLSKISAATNTVTGAVSPTGTLPVSNTGGGGLQWMGGKGIFDATVTTLGTAMGIQSFDLTGTTPVAITKVNNYNPIIGTTAPYSYSVLGAYSGITRYGRLATFQYNTNMIQADYDALNATDFVITTGLTQAGPSDPGQYVIHLGTHLLAMSNNGILMTPTAGSLNSISNSGQLLLPK